MVQKSRKYIVQNNRKYMMKQPMRKCVYALSDESKYWYIRVKEKPNEFICASDQGIFIQHHNNILNCVTNMARLESSFEICSASTTVNS